MSAAAENSQLTLKEFLLGGPSPVIELDADAAEYEVVYGDAGYTVANLITDQGLDVFRRNPTANLPDTEIAGLNHYAKETCDNGIDEVSQMVRGGRVTMVICLDRLNDTYQLICKDNGRGLPLEGMMRMLTQPHSSGKFNQEAYGTSSGQHGMGAKLTAATSNHYRFISERGSEGSGSLYIHMGKHDLLPILDPTPRTVCGSTVVFEPDQTIFTHVKEYVDGHGYMPLVELFRKFSFFRSQIVVEFKVLQEALPFDYWSASTDEALQIVDSVVAKATTIFSSLSYDRIEWLRRYWNLPGGGRHFASGVTIDYKNADKDGRLSAFTVMLFREDGHMTGGRFGLVNNVPLDGAATNHLSTLYETLSLTMAPWIPDPAMRTFFLEKYSLPLHVAVDVKFKGAKFTGLLKTSFIMKEFRELYQVELRRMFALPDIAPTLKEIFAALLPDITKRYESMLSGGAIKSGKLHEIIRRWDEFTDCGTSNRSLAELFMMEGESAGGCTGHDTETQAIYYLGGKPFNGIRSFEHLAADRQRIMRNDIYHDVYNLIRYRPGQLNFDGMYFSRAILCADADAHGRHITSLMLSNFYAVSPELVESGFFWVAIPPYYELRVGKKDPKNKNRVFLRNRGDVERWLIARHYFHVLRVEIARSDKNWGLHTLDADEFFYFGQMVLRVGSLIEQIGEELGIPPHVVEALAGVTAYLPNYGTPPDHVNVHQLATAIGADKVVYDHQNYILTVAAGMDDFVIPLHSLKDRIYRDLLPLLAKMGRRQMADGRNEREIYITTLNTPHFRRHEASIYMVYMLFMRLNEVMEIDYFKGLGSMEPEDKADTCLDRNWRTIYQIKGVDSVQTIFDLMGDKSEDRKRLGISL